MATILAVDDTPYNLDILKHSLEDDGHEVLMAENGQTALEMVSRHQPDLVLLDISMPIMDGREVLRRLRGNDKYRHLPVIMLTADTLDESVAQCLEAGANDYVTKPFSLKVLSARIKATLRDSQSRRQLQEDNTQLSAIANLDQETGLLKKDAFAERFKREFATARQSGKLLALAHIAIDDFGSLYNRHGDEVIDNIMRTFSAVLVKVFRSSDLIAHMEGNRFTVCMPNTRSFQVLGIIERLRKTLAEADWGLGKREEPVSACIGVAMMVNQTTTAHELEAAAERALAQATGRGSDQIVLAATAEG